MRIVSLMVLPLAIGCTNQPSHIPNPVLLPAHAVTSVVQNGSYNARRSRVKAYVSENWDALRADIAAGSGEVLSKAMTLARVPPAKRAALIAELQTSHVHSASPENMTVALMVHGD